MPAPAALEFDDITKEYRSFFRRERIKAEGAKQNGFIEITVPALNQLRTIEQIWLAGGEVLAVHPIRRTLEDLFVELAHQNGGGRGASGPKREESREGSRE